MNHPFFKLSGLTLIFVLFLAACTSDDDPSVPPGNETASFFLAKVIFAGHDTTIYEYDNQKRIAKAWLPANANTNSKYYKEFAYDAQGRLVKSTFKLLNGTTIGYNTLEYTNNRLTLVSSYSRPQGTGDFTHDFDNILEYNGANQVIKLITRKPGKPATAYRYTNYQYNPAGNVIKIMDYVNEESGPVNDYIAEYTYDDKNNPYFGVNLNGLGPSAFSPNNILNEKETYPLSGQVKNTTRTYTYNEAGFPVKETRTSNAHTFEIQNSYTVLK
ncbi:hypothetical protein HUW51_22170 [Adhaeribacter swui]|uniref:RHS repeat protein n=1 Tax=Adhaeribacter swui TaxID=2086471 RepID=A0A7G7GDQ7_9BACT|nr:hypothetical protein [Adhaeribacter swui]QNF35291.1 hypothetical protein HUW51_22170 [Adhaeribacter swui]